MPNALPFPHLHAPPASPLATAPDSPSTCTTFFRPRCAPAGVASSRTPQATAQSAPGPRAAPARTWGHQALSPTSWPLPFGGLAPWPSFSATRISQVPRPPPRPGSQRAPPRRLADPYPDFPLLGLHTLAPAQSPRLWTRFPLVLSSNPPEPLTPTLEVRSPAPFALAQARDAGRGEELEERQQQGYRCARRLQQTGPGKGGSVERGKDRERERKERQRQREKQGEMETGDVVICFFTLLRELLKLAVVFLYVPFQFSLFAG